MRRVHATSLRETARNAFGIKTVSAAPITVVRRRDDRNEHGGEIESRLEGICGNLGKGRCNQRRLEAETHERGPALADRRDAARDDVARGQVGGRMIAVHEVRPLPFTRQRPPSERPDSRSLGACSTSSAVGGWN